MTIPGWGLRSLLPIFTLGIVPPLYAHGPAQPTSQPTSAPAGVCPLRPVVTASLTKGAAPAAYYQMTPLGTPPITVYVTGQSVSQPDHNILLRDMTFATQGLNGEPIRVPSDFRGKLVVVHFWASWCPNCTHEAPYWVAANQAFKNRSVAFVGIPVDKNRALSLDTVKTKAAQAGMTWPQAFVDAPTLSLNFHINSLPAAYIVDGDTGRVLAQGNSIRGERLAGVLDALLRQQKSPAPAPLLELTDTGRQLPMSGPAHPPGVLENAKAAEKGRMPSGSR